jgi:4-amino-4-deoxy-L-arabinose transferase-like glycosyltransferase
MRFAETHLVDTTVIDPNPHGDYHGRHHRVWVLLSLIVVAGFAVRLVALAYLRTGAIESEGAEYARIAENLRNGVGYVGLATPGPQINFPPLFPLLIAGTSFVTHNYEWAGRLVSLILGALLPLPVFGITSRLFNRRVGFIAAILALLHPLLIHLSFTVFSEGPYATMLLSAVYVVVRVLNQPSTKLWLMVGGAFGLTYLLRAEASGVFAIAVLFALTATQGGAAVKYKRAFAAILVFFALALPEVIFIYESTGKVRLEEKSEISFYTSRRILAAQMTPGADYESADGGHEIPSSAPNAESGERWEEKWAWYGVDSHLQGTGAAMRSFGDSVRGIRITRKDIFFLEKSVGRNISVLLQRLSSDWLGAPFLPALALLGALRRPWRRPQASSRLFVLLVAAVPIVANPFALMPSDPRYSFIFVPLFCIWAASGLFELGQWMRASSAAAGWKLAARPLVSKFIVPGLIGLVVIVTSAKGVRALDDLRESAVSSRVDKELGLWIGHQQNDPIRIMDLQIPLAYHAGAQFSHFPYCTGESALRYLDEAQVDYIVLRRDEIFTKYYADWLVDGIPDARAERLHVPPDTNAVFVVYRWHRGV